MGRWGSFLWGQKLWAEPTLLFKINGSYVNGKNLYIQDLLTNEANTASFEIYDTYANKPTNGQQVEIYFGDTKLFAGRITSSPAEKLNNAGANTEYIFYIECTDWQMDLDKKLVVETYTSQTLSAIVIDIITNYTSGFTTNNVVTTAEPTIDKIIFNYKYVSECFEQLREITGWDWYVDYDKDIHFFPQEENDAPIELLDNGEEFADLVITPDKSQLRNRVFVRGGYYLSTLYSEDQRVYAAGVTSYQLDYIPRDSFDIQINSVSETVGIDGVDAVGTYDWLLNANEKLIKKDQSTVAPADTVDIDYKYPIDLITMMEDMTSQNAVKTIEGGDGVYEYYINAPEITDLNTAKDRARAELEQYGNPLVEGSFVSIYDGWRSGQRLHIQLTDRNNLDEYYLIRGVTIEALSPNKLKYTVTFATFLQGFNWLLIKLLDKIKPSMIDVDEVLFKYYNMYETINLGESYSTTEFTPPYKWGPHADEGKWSAAEWS